MAKPRPVKGLDPDARLQPNARKVLAVRIDEMYAYDQAGPRSGQRHRPARHAHRLQAPALRARDLRHRLHRRPGAVARADQAAAGPAGRHPRLRRAGADARGPPGLARRARGRRGAAAGGRERGPGGGRPAHRGGVPGLPAPARGGPAGRRAPGRARAHRPAAARAQRPLRPLHRPVAAPWPTRASATASRPPSGSSAVAERLALFGDVHGNMRALRAPCWAPSRTRASRRPPAPATW